MAGGWFEFTGGGVAILDYDRDGWPDVYLTHKVQMAGAGKRGQALRPSVPKTLATISSKTSRYRLDWVTDGSLHRAPAIGDVNNDGFSRHLSCQREHQPAVHQQRRRDV